MQREIITTSDGSKTIYLPDWNEHYHSKHGAVQEANHVFINAGLLYFLTTNPTIKALNILEIGFGTGLNAFLTLLEAKKNKLQVNYTGIEKFPIQTKEIIALNYAKTQREVELFTNLHTSIWEKTEKISACFYLLKQQKYFKDINNVNEFNLIYFDAFGARVQPELWQEDIFKNMYLCLKKGGILVTYSAKGSVRRAMQAVGFKVDKLPGPPGKREMLQAIKI